MPYSIHHPDGTVAETAATLDHAQHVARHLSLQGGRVIVRDAERAIRGFGEHGAWHWAQACRECEGTGRTPVGMAAPSLPFNIICERCGGWGAEANEAS
jgi:hypothetical protein